MFLLACSGSAKISTNPDAPPRTYRLGFSVVPPRPDTALAIRVVQMWARRADLALMHLDVPWAALLAGARPRDIIAREHEGLAAFYRRNGLVLAITVDVTNGLARDREAPALVDAGRSITEPEIQRLYVDYVAALDSALQPEWLGLAAETNLVRAVARRPVYDAIVAMTNRAAGALAPLSRALLYVSVQVETAWGRLPPTGSYVGIAEDRRDFPFIEALGLSSYPYVGGFDAPEDLPLDYYARLVAGDSIPMLVVEGGWPSESVGPIVSSPAEQARWIARQMRLADEARLTAVAQIPFTDLDLARLPVAEGSILPLFATIGLVDAELRPKVGLATWDSAFARPLRQ